MKRQQFTDNDLLSWVRDRANGMTPKQIADKCNASEHYIRAATNRVRAADIEHSKDPNAARAYW